MENNSYLTVLVIKFNARIEKKRSTSKKTNLVMTQIRLQGGWGGALILRRDIGGAPRRRGVLRNAGVNRFAEGDDGQGLCL